MPSKPAHDPKGEVLVAILNNHADFAILQEQHWYRIPVANAPRRWPPKWLAFYQTKVFGDQAFAVQYYGRVAEIRTVPRVELFPNEIESARSRRLYFQLRLEVIERLPLPIPSRRLRRVVFIPTTFHKFHAAEEINDLFDDSPLEDSLWAQLKRHKIPAERQWPVPHEERFYQLDFAIFCNQGQIDVEADGDTWHSGDRTPRDNERNNALADSGWYVLRFNGQQIRENAARYCTTRVAKMIKRLGGLQEGLVPRQFYTDGDQTIQQLSLFERGPDYDATLDSIEAWPNDEDPPSSNNP